MIIIWKYKQVVQGNQNKIFEAVHSYGEEILLMINEAIRSLLFQRSTLKNIQEINNDESKGKLAY